MNNCVLKDTTFCVGSRRQCLKRGFLELWETSAGSCVTTTTNVIRQKEYKIKFQYFSLGTKLLLRAAKAFAVINSENKDKFQTLRNDKRPGLFNFQFVYWARKFLMNNKITCFQRSASSRIHEGKNDLKQDALSLLCYFMFSRRRV